MDNLGEPEQGIAEKNGYTAMSTSNSHIENGLKKLLLSGEYEELKDDVLVEGQFVELDKRGDPVRDVILGLTKDSFVIAKRAILDSKERIYTDTESHLDIADMEIEWIVPIFHVNISKIRDKEYGTLLIVTARSGRRRVFMMSIVNGNREQRWAEWTQAFNTIRQDPYLFSRMVYTQSNIQFGYEDENKKLINVDSIRDLPQLSKYQSGTKPVCTFPGTKHYSESACTVLNAQRYSEIELNAKSSDNVRVLFKEQSLLKSTESISIKPKLLDRASSLVSLAKSRLFAKSVEVRDVNMQVDIPPKMRHVAVQVDIPLKKKKRCFFNCFKSYTE